MDRRSDRVVAAHSKTTKKKIRLYDTIRYTIACSRLILSHGR